MNFILFVIAFILVVVFTPLGFLYTALKSIVLFDAGYLGRYYKALAVSLDQFGGVAMQSVFNWLLIAENGHKFGSPDETISSVLGKNYLNGTLKGWGFCLNSFLNKLEKDHTINSIEK